MSEERNAIVYIDGLNLYGAALSKSDHKWVDLMTAAASLVPAGFSMSSVKYFSAELNPSFAEDPASITRQRHYMKALKASGVDVRRGTFMVPRRFRTVAPGEPWSERMRPPPSPALQADLAALEATSTRPLKVKVQLPEEKFTDVAIGVELVDDFHRGACSQAVLITNDSDLQPAILKVVSQGHLVHVVSPPSYGRSAPQARRYIVRCDPTDMSPRSSIPGRVHSGNGREVLATESLEAPKITKAHPTGWALRYPRSRSAGSV